MDTFDQLLTPFTGHLLISFISFIVVFFLILILFAHKKTIKFLYSVLCVVGFIVLAPFRFILNIIHQPSFSIKDLLSPDKHVHQYLYRSFFRILEILVVLFAVAAFSVGVAGGFASMFPSESAIKDAERIKNDIGRYENRLSDLGKKISALEDEWEEKKKDYEEKCFKECRQIMDKANSENLQLESSMLTSDTVKKMMAQIKKTFDDNKKRGLDEKKQALLSKINSLGELTTQDKSILRKYIDNIYNSIRAEIDIDNVNDTDLRKEIQPEYENLKSEKGKLESEAQTYQDDYRVARYNIKWKPLNLVKGFIAGLLQFLAFVWVLGLLLEGMEILLNISTDLACVRRSLEVADDDNNVEIK